LRLHENGFPLYYGGFSLRNGEFQMRNYDVADALIVPRFPVVLLNVDQPLIEGCVWRTLCFA
jgi:hypothetical protein